MLLLLTALNPIHLLLWALIVGLVFAGLYYISILLPPEGQKPARVVLVILAIIVLIWILLPYAGARP